MEVLIFFSFYVDCINFKIISEREIPQDKVRFILKADSMVRSILGIDPPNYTIVFLKTTESFIKTCKAKWWQGGGFRNDTIYLQPLRVLEKRGVFEKIVIHEIVHVCLSSLNLPRYIEEGLCVYLAGEDCDKIQQQNVDKEKIKELLNSKNMYEYKMGLCLAGVYVEKLVKKYGLNKIIEKYSKIEDVSKHKEVK